MPITKERTMSALITTTSQAVETLITDFNGNIVETRYHDSECQAENYLSRKNIVRVEVERLNF